MPELPEVETTRRGIIEYSRGNTIRQLIVRNRQLRWPVCKGLEDTLKNRRVNEIHRRGKYLLLEFDNGTLLWHLGMSGSLRVVRQSTPLLKHDHVDMVFNDSVVLRFNDPRRFGAIVWSTQPVCEHSLIKHLGPEPLSDEFDGQYLYEYSRKRAQAVKSWIMDSKVVVGVGNIYANESLFAARIHPLKAVGKLTKVQCSNLANEIKSVLARAIELGGTTLRDFVGGDGKPGYFAQQLSVYGRAGEPCIRCHKALTQKRIGQRATVYCTQCQK